MLSSIGSTSRLKCNKTIFMFRFFSLLHGPDAGVRRGAEQSGAVNSGLDAGRRDPPRSSARPLPYWLLLGTFLKEGSVRRTPTSCLPLSSLPDITRKYILPATARHSILIFRFFSLAVCVAFMPASGGVRSRAEPSIVSLMQVEEIPPLQRPSATLYSTIC